MSPNNHGNFVNDLVEMAKAFEALPKVQSDLDLARHDIDGYLATIQRLELKLVDRANEIDSLNSRIRSLEVERDDAQFHALEADDRTGRALDFIKATFGNAGSLIQALEPPRAEPEPVKTEPEAQPTTQPQGQSEPLPSSPVTDVAGPQSVNESEPSASGTTASEPSPAQEVAPAHPTTDATLTAAHSANSPTGTSPMPEPVQSSADATSTPAPVDQSFSMPHATDNNRFAGKKYSEVIKDGVYPSRQEWEANGGTLDTWYA